MALFNTSIDDWVQEELFRRMDNPVSPEFAARSTWLRMCSMAEGGKDLKLCGGILSPDGKMLGGLEQMYPKNFLDLMGRNVTDRASAGYSEPQEGRPIPGITGASVQTKGSWGSTLSATVQWQCWSLEQLELLSQYFLRPRLAVALEFGWSSTADYVDSDLLAEPAEAANASHNLEKEGKGNYFGFLGAISNFNWTTRADGGFDCTTTIMTAGANLHEMKVGSGEERGVPANEAENDAATAAKNPEVAVGHIGRYLEQAVSELKKVTGSGNKKAEYNKNKVKNVWMNDRTKPDKDVQCYVSWGWLEDNVISRFYGLQSQGKKKNKDGQPLTYDYRSLNRLEDGTYESAKCVNHPMLRSKKPAICWLPKGGEADDAFEPFGVEGDEYSGYIRNIVLNVDTCRDAFSEVESIEQAYQNLFAKVNQQCGGVFDFAIQPDDDNTCRMKVVDMNWANKMRFDENRSKPGNTTNKVFWFPAFSKNSIVKNQTMTCKVPSAMTLAAMYMGDRKAEVTLGADAENDDIVFGLLENGPDAPIDELNDGLSVPKDFGNNTGDPNDLLKKKGAHSLSSSLKKANKKSVQEHLDAKSEELQEEYEELVKQRGDSGMTAEEILEDAKTTRKDEELKEKFSEIPWYKGLSDDSYRVMVQTVNAGTVNGMKGLQSIKKPKMPLELELTIDGIAGLRFGNVFQSEYIPQKYKNDTVFMVTSITHTINQQTWETSFKGVMRAGLPKGIG